MTSLTLVFVHGYSVTNFSTYGELPQRLKNEAERNNLSFNITDVYLGRYISFNDEVRLSDLAKAFQNAVKDQISAGNRFICITHSTGAPLVRTWLQLFYTDPDSSPCPLTHLIMLAPANHGSALAQLGKGRLSRIKSWFDNVEPGQKILNWLELGSEEAWQLNKSWILSESSDLVSRTIFPFILSGQDVDRKLYDHLNSYTGEAGSDGVVRIASANLNSSYIALEQPVSELTPEKPFSGLVITSYKQAPLTAMRILSKRAHSGDTLGIIKSIRSDTEELNSKETIDAIFECISVNTKEEYSRIYERFILESGEVQNKSVLEIEQKVFKRNYFIHDRYSMVIFRIRDNEGYPVTNFDLILTTGEDNNPDDLPKGFFADRQRNQTDHGTLTYYFNYDLMVGSIEIQKEGEVIRSATRGIESLGLSIHPRPDEGFVRYKSCEIKACKELMQKIIKPNSTTLVEICLYRLLSTELFRYEKNNSPLGFVNNFKNVEPGSEFIS